MALWTYTIVPLPRPEELVCDGTVRAQLVPFRFLGDIETGGGVGGLLRDPALRQVILNIALFIPLGVFLRHLFRWPRRWCVVAGLGMSLAIELTQLTGNWFAYPCAYRLFDVDDLLANTLGAVIGVALAPLARWVPGQHLRPADQPQPVRPVRRLTGMAVDLVSVQLIGFAVPFGIAVALYLADRDHEAHAVLIQILTTSVAAVVLLILVPARTGATLGQRLVFLRLVRPDGRAPGWTQWLIRGLTGTGGYVVLTLPHDAGVTGFGPLGYAWAALSVAVVVFVSTRGVSGFASGLVVVDSREPDRHKSLAQRGTDPRRLSSAVFVIGALLYLGVSGLVAIASLSPLVGLGLAGVVALGLVVVNLALTGYLLHTGLVVVRREGRSLGNLLNLLAVLGVLGLILLLVVAWLLRWHWLVVVAVAGLALTAHLSLLLGAFVLYGAVYARRPPVPEMDAIVVLGSRVYGERVPPLLAARIDRGLQVLDAEIAQGRSPLLVLSGGQGPDETAAEGVVMAGMPCGPAPLRPSSGPRTGPAPPRRTSPSRATCWSRRVGAPTWSWRPTTTTPSGRRSSHGSWASTPRSSVRPRRATTSPPRCCASSSGCSPAPRCSMARSRSRSWPAAGSWPG